jgi:hypothetical protein
LPHLQVHLIFARNAQRVVPVVVRVSDLRKSTGSKSTTTHDNVSPACKDAFTASETRTEHLALAAHLDLAVLASNRDDISASEQSRCGGLNAAGHVVAYAHSVHDIRPPLLALCHFTRPNVPIANNR